MATNPKKKKPKKGTTPKYKSKGDKLLERKLNKDPFAKAKRQAKKTRLA